MKKQISFIIFILYLISVSVQSDPPKPPIVYRWALMENFSDEFNGTQTIGWVIEKVVWPFRGSTLI